MNKAMDKWKDMWYCEYSKILSVLDDGYMDSHYTILPTFLYAWGKSPKINKKNTYNS